MQQEHKKEQWNNATMNDAIILKQWANLLKQQQHNNNYAIMQQWKGYNDTATMQWSKNAKKQQCKEETMQRSNDVTMKCNVMT